MGKRNPVSALPIKASLFLATLLWVVAINSVHAQTRLQLPEKTDDYRLNPPHHLKNAPLRPGFQPIDNHKATLGRVLFYDKSLSANKLVSCSSCHKQANAFDDPTRFSIGFKGLITARNSMGLANAALNINGRYFWDERASNLSEQVLQPFTDPVEMGLKDGELIQLLREKPYYKTLFTKAFGNDRITGNKIATALASFIDAITSFNSSFDKARQSADNILQDFPDFTRMQNRGKKLFFTSAKTGGAGCFSCHRTLAMISTPGGENNGLDAYGGKDQGIGKISGNPEDNAKFRVPSLRNIAIRAPYMHDGRFPSLSRVIDHYSTGIKNHPNLGQALRDQNGKPRRFNFSPTDKQALIEFLKTLNDAELVSDPKFSDPFK